MRSLFRPMILIALLVMAAPLVMAEDAVAQYREFVGKVDRISKKKMVVDNRQGDKVPFESSKDTVVSGEGKKEWKEIKKGDWVSVSWKMMDKPRIAYEVNVLPPRKEAGEDE